MMIEEALRTKLLANASLTAAIGQRLFVQELPQGETVPAIVLVMVSNVPQYAAATSLENSLVQFSSFAPTIKQAKENLKIVRDDIQNFNGTLSGLYVSSIRLESEMTHDRGSENRYAHCSGDFRIYFN